MNIEKKLHRAQMNYSAAVATIAYKLSPKIEFSFRLNWRVVEWVVVDTMVGHEVPLDKCLLMIEAYGALSYGNFLNLK